MSHLELPVLGEISPCCHQTEDFGGSFVSQYDPLTSEHLSRSNLHTLQGLREEGKEGSLGEWNMR